MRKGDSALFANRTVTFPSSRGAQLGVKQTLITQLIEQLIRNPDMLRTRLWLICLQSV